MPAISVERLGKIYRVPLPRQPAPGWGAALRHPVSAARRLGSSPHEAFRALRDLSFDVQRGEVIGLIGLNGAGKSTLLKILSRVTEPTSGRAVIRGRVGSLLEVGTGFHPELTGRENIQLSGAILGMRRTEIARRFDEIVAFAEVEKFLELPVKRYSSGMYVRLAFAVAAHLEPEVLLVDEVLAVGDVTFQKKCLGKMNDVGKQGRTILFVSHNMVAVQNLCQRAIWLHQGELRADGPAGDVSRDYLSASSTAATEWSETSSGETRGNEKVTLRRLAIRPADGSQGDLIGMSTPLVVEIDFVNHEPDARLHVSLQVLSDQAVAFTTESNETDPQTRDNPLSAGLYRSQCTIPSHLLNSGLHGLTVLFRQHGRKLVLRCDSLISFEVLDLDDRPGTWLGRAQGVVHPRLEWQTQLLEPSDR